MPSSGTPVELQAWIDARKRHRLSHAQVQMARELGMNPRKLGGIDNHRQEPWKAPLPQFIEHLYHKRFGRDTPLDVRPLEERAREAAARKTARKAEKRARREAE
jgi:SOS-response transcriptional repressor LexA